MTRSVLLLLLGVAFTGCVTAGPNWDTPPNLDDVAEQYLEINGAWLRVRDQGPRDMGHLPIILVHGYGSRLEAWRELQPRLAQRRRVVSYDQRGFGHSSRAEGAYGPEQHAKDLIKLMDTLDIDEAVLVGHSYGGGVVMRAALEAKDRVRGVGLVSAFALEEDIPTDFRWAKVPGVGELLFGAFFKEVPGEKYLLAFDDRDQFVSLEALDEMEAMMDKDGAVYAALATVRGMDYAEAQAQYRDLDVPIVLVWGEKDRVVPLENGKRLAAVIDAPLVVLPACGHMPSWERPKSLWRALSPMVKEAEAKSGRGAPAPDTMLPPAVPPAGPEADVDPAPSSEPASPGEKPAGDVPTDETDVPPAEPADDADDMDDVDADSEDEAETLPAGDGERPMAPQRRKGAR